MFTINNKEIKLSSSDTLDSLKNKIAASLGTLPPLIDNIPKITNGGNYTLQDPLFYIDTSLHIRKINGEPITWDEIKKTTDFDMAFLQKLYIITKVQSTLDDFGGGINPNDALAFALLDLQNEPDFFDGNYNENVWLRRTETIKEFENMINQNRENLKKQNKVNNEWENIQVKFTSTSFVLNKINHQTEIPNTLKQNELMVFDSINLNNVIIGCFYQDMIKYNEEYKHLIDDYLNQDKIFSKKLKAADVIRVMITFDKPNSRIKYKMINVYVQPDTIILTIETLINETYSDNASNSLKNLIKDIILNIGEEAGYQQIQEKDFFYGSYTASINTPLIVLKDLVTNDSNVYHLSYINESALINTRKTNLNIFLKSNTGQKSNDIGVSLFERPDTVGTLIRLKKIRGGLDFKSRVDNYILTINKILQYTFLKANSIIKFYQNYIDLNIEVTSYSKEVTGKENLLKLQAPDIFVANYTRLCNKPPVIVDNVEAENDTILKFPIYGESDPKYYTCPYPDYKYPGLRENTKLSNKNLYPFVPCCYQRPQKKSKNYKMYYSQEVYTQRINAGEIGKSLKILAPERLGALPSKIDKLLLYTTKTKFYRYGIPLSLSSCLSVLNKVTNNQESEENIRLNLAKRAELCKGEFNLLSVKEISQKIMDPSTYISPKYFKGALEDYYQISYILFSIDKDDFEVYPNKFVKFICPLKKRVILMIEHEDKKHVELIVDEETSTYVNKQGKKPIFTFEKNDSQIKKIFELYQQRFNYTVYNIKDKKFDNLLITSKDDTFNIYPWEYRSPNGKVVKVSQPLNQYVDNYGQTRLVEFSSDGINFVGEFQPLPCLKLPIKDIEYFISINDNLVPQQVEIVTKKFLWLKLYRTKLILNQSYKSPHTSFNELKKLAEYLLWAACHFYALYNIQTNKNVDDWITTQTQIVENFTYSRVTVKPIFDSSELLVNNKFIFNSLEFQERIRFNLSLISSVNLRVYATNIYSNFYKNIANFNVKYPAQLALSKKEYFQRTRKPYILNILTTENIQYLEPDTLYYIKDLFGTYSNSLCLFFTSLEKLTEIATQFLGQKIILDETKLNISVFDQKIVQQYTVGTSEPNVNIISLNINGHWFYGLLLPDLI
ncbi:Dynein-like beta chain [Invertebrate iridescent virus 22]|uniref:Dynein-like beta chain n=1 Tax=Invertebrate iridescent virus 22 TaxID=345198 RepID=W8W1A4_9VIRU|nr:Dynein-like beta chain [Invertebrate iridescent virus 22]CCV01868.1 Dynein-like beta chain [Invertebrate iridescent virus 22]